VHLVQQLECSSTIVRSATLHHKNRLRIFLSVLVSRCEESVYRNVLLQVIQMPFILADTSKVVCTKFAGLAYFVLKVGAALPTYCTIAYM
jgi:hypothetical protein